MIKVEIDERGNLMLIPQTYTEKYAINAWFEKNHSAIQQISMPVLITDIEANRPKTGRAENGNR